MAATVIINEYNGAGETETTNITNTNMGNVDSVNLDPVAYPVTPGNNTYEKWQKISVTNMGGSSQVNNLKVWRTGALGGSAVHKTNARLATYGGAEAYAQPVKTTSSVADQTMPSSVPARAITVAAKSDYLVHQIQTNAGDIAGSTSVMSFQYDEIA
jgi:hypothetical protein